MYFTIEKAGLTRTRFRARLYGANNELVWYTQVYKNKQSADDAIRFLNVIYGERDWDIRDQT